MKERGLSREGVRKVFLFVDDGAVAQDRVMALDRLRPEEPEELSESAVQGVELLGRAEMPLADDPRRVSRTRESVGEGPLGGGKPDPLLRLGAHRARIDSYPNLS
jgi:hypothetical protein